MRFLQAIALLSVLCAIAGFAATGGSKKATSSKSDSASKGTKKSSSASNKGTGKKSAGKASASSAAKNKTEKKAPASTWRNRQQNPTPDRYREIQSALVAKGYLKGDPSGVWDADSIGAMQRFQMDQKLNPSGKINAASLIGLGLGAKSAGASEAPPLPPPSETPPPAAGQPQ